MTLLERIQKAQGCSRDDDPSQHDKPRKAVQPEWLRRAQRQPHGLARDMTRGAA